MVEETAILHEIADAMSIGLAPRTSIRHVGGATVHLRLSLEGPDRRIE
jgi:hypothetical protein